MPLLYFTTLYCTRYNALLYLAVVDIMMPHLIYSNYVIMMTIIRALGYTNYLSSY